MRIDPVNPSEVAFGASPLRIRAARKIATLSRIGRRPRRFVRRRWARRD